MSVSYHMSESYKSRVLNRSQSASNWAEADRPLVILVDDEASLREALQELMHSVGIDTISFASTGELLEAELPDRPGCLVADVRMPGLSGLDLQCRLAESGEAKPIIFLTAHGDIPMSVQAMKAGAVDFLTKPVRDQTLLDAIAAGIELDIQRRAHSRILKEYLSKFALLTPRERQVLREVAVGRAEQADRFLPRHQRYYCQAPSLQRHAQDAADFRRRTRSRLGDVACRGTQDCGGRTASNALTELRNHGRFMPERR